MPHLAHIHLETYIAVSGRAERGRETQREISSKQRLGDTTGVR